MALHQRLRGGNMPTDLHCICKEGERWRKLSAEEFETGDWVVGFDTAQEAVGGRIFLHEHQNSLAWHGGTITFWHYGDTEDRKVFLYTLDGDFRIPCVGNWAQELAIVRR
jgi:hypothetical protein